MKSKKLVVVRRRVRTHAPRENFQMEVDAIVGRGAEDFMGQLMAMVGREDLCIVQGA